MEQYNKLNIIKQQITEVMWEVERLGASEKLTEIIVSLSKIKESLSDCVECK